MANPKRVNLKRSNRKMTHQMGQKHKALNAMANPNDVQWRQIRDALQAMANNLKEIKKQIGGELSDDELEQIRNDIRDALNNADAANASAIQGTANNIKMCVSKIEDAKKSVDDALKNLARIKNVLKLSTNIVTLAAAVMTGNIQAIILAAADVVNAAA